MKELWLAAWERLYEHALERGDSDEVARQFADEHADNALRESLYDRADMERKRRREEGSK